jgi:tRNA pseudouridine32 synthase/23S rRNA pseudouridine746 synthase
MTPEDLVARVLYRDALMLVIDKPSGLPVHAGPKGGETLDQHFDALSFGLPRRPELAHRLDRETSGCLVLGRHRKALADLGKMFQRGTIEKIYLAVVRGGPPDDAGRVDIPISKRDAQRGWFMKVDHENGQTASTSYRVLGRAGGFSLVELTLHTGRTHQIRVHMAAIGCPVLGERIYATSPPPPAGPILHLHSWRVGVPLYPKRDTVRVVAPLPPHIEATLQALGLRAAVDAAEATYGLERV